MGGWGMGAVVAAWLVSPAPPAKAPAAAGTAAFRVRIGRPLVAHSVQAALLGAQRRLRGAACNGVFGDFKDGQGRTLQDNLDALAMSGAHYLSFIGFYDGEGQPQCERSTRNVAFTAPGSRNVWVCSLFALEHRRDRGRAEALLIHEALHSLGLRENPPSTHEITDRVVARCGR